MYGLEKGSFMVKRYFLRRNNTTTGPFTEPQLRQMLIQQQLLPGDELSEDKRNFFNAGAVLGTVIYPPRCNAATPGQVQSPAAPADAVDDDLPEAPPVCKAPEAPAPVQPIVLQTPGAALPETTVLTAEAPENIYTDARERQTWLVVSCTYASLYNGSSYLQRLWHLGSGNMCIAGILSLFNSILFTLLGCVIFAHKYSSVPAAFYLRSLIFTLCCWCLLWIFNSLVRFLAAPTIRPGSAEADFLSASHGAMCVALTGTVINATVSIILHNLSNLTSASMISLLAITLLLLMLMFSNIIVSLRINFMDGTRLGAGFATFWAVIELWGTLLLGLLLLKSLYIVQ